MPYTRAMQPGVRLLGTPSIRKGGEWLELPLDKRLALLTYLACSTAWVSREQLSFLFWPDTSSASARINLRQLLARTKTLPLSVEIEADDKRLRWAVGSDVSEFRTAVHDADWAGAIRRYRGDLAADLVVTDASEFMSWLEFERARLRESHRHAVLHEAEIAAAAGLSEEAVAHYEELLLRDPLDESVMQALLRLLVRLGAVEEARRRLQAFAVRLQAELGFAPSSATELIVSGAGAAHEQVGAPALATPQDSPATHARLTAPLTSFVGRERELASIAERLGTEDCRLLTLVGPAGVGKTRLALRAAQLFGSTFAHGAVPVPLANVEDAEGLAHAIAAALGSPASRAER